MNTYHLIMHFVILKYNLEFNGSVFGVLKIGVRTLGWKHCTCRDATFHPSNLDCKYLSHLPAGGLFQDHQRQDLDATWTQVEGRVLRPLAVIHFLTFDITANCLCILTFIQQQTVL